VLPIFPIRFLKPWVRDELKKFNDDALAGKVQYTPIARCRPAGVPGAILLRLNPMFIVQTPKQVTFLYQSDHQVRRIYMNQSHSAKLRRRILESRSGTTKETRSLSTQSGLRQRLLRITTIPRTTDQFHVVERYRLIDGGQNA
jgi:hypothetical protein